MLDHDELLPEEQTSSDLVRELGLFYQLKPEEKQVLTHVHERLAQKSYSFPLLEPERAGDSMRSQQLDSPIFVPIRPTKTTKTTRATGFKQRWLQGLNSLAAAIIVGTLVGSLVLTFAFIAYTRVSSPCCLAGGGNGTNIVLIPAKRGSIPSQAEMEATRLLLIQRFSAFDLRGASTSLETVGGQPAILIELPRFGSNEKQVINTLVETGVLAFWDTGLNILPATRTFDPTQYVQFNPGGQPRFTNQDIDSNIVYLSTDSQTGQTAIGSEMKGSAINRFQQFTASHIGDALTITLDGKVLSSSVILSSIAGPFDILSSYTGDQARAIVSVLRFSPLPVELKQSG